MHAGINAWFGSIGTSKSLIVSLLNVDINLNPSQQGGVVAYTSATHIWTTQGFYP